PWKELNIARLRRFSESRRVRSESGSIGAAICCEDSWRTRDERRCRVGCLAPRVAVRNGCAGGRLAKKSTTPVPHHANNSDGGGPGDSRDGREHDGLGCSI